MEFLNTITHWYWFAFACALIILDVSIGISFFLLWLGVAAASVGIILWIFPTLPWEYQFIIFAIESIACIFFWHLYLKKHPTKTDKPQLNRRSAQYIGRYFTLDTPIENGRGKITVDDSMWRVEGEDLPAGTRIKVVAVDGVILKVRKTEK